MLRLAERGSQASGLGGPRRQGEHGEHVVSDDSRDGGAEQACDEGSAKIGKARMPGMRIIACPTWQQPQLTDFTT
jgi:hypothetical protein